MSPVVAMHLMPLNGGKEGDQVHRNLERDVAMQLLEFYFRTDRNVCTNNFFTSYTSHNCSNRKNPILSKTIKNHRREVFGTFN